MSLIIHKELVGFKPENPKLSPAKRDNIEIIIKHPKVKKEQRNNRFR